MRKLSIFVWGILFSYVICGTSFAEQPGTVALAYAITTCQKYLVEAGLENLQFQIAPNHTIWIAYENRRYRNEITAFGIVLGYASECFSFIRHFVIVPKFRNIPLKYINVNRVAFQQFKLQQISADDFIEQLEISFQPSTEKQLAGYGSPNTQSSFFKIDLVSSPGIKTQFARPNDPVQLQFSLLTNISSTLASGLQLNCQWILPLYNEFQSQQGQSRMERLYLDQFWRLPSSTFLTLSAGLFDYGCLGISTQIKRFFWQDRFSISARVDYLRANSLKEGLGLDSPCQNKASYLFQAQSRFDQIHFKTKLTWGQYLLGDKGWRIDIVRQFHELELGFMGVWNESLEFLTGMTIRVPFPISRQPCPDKIRIRPPKFVPWNYRYLPCFDGFILNKGDNFEDIAHQFTKSFIRANIHQLKVSSKYVKFDRLNTSESYLAKKGK
jgi:hypothetical protein